jgi:hypothetical protein
MIDMDAATFEKSIIKFYIKSNHLFYIPSCNNTGNFLCSAGKCLNEYDEHSYSNHRIFDLLELSKEKFTMLIVGYQPSDGDWPEVYTLKDLMRVVAHLYAVIEIQNSKFNTL